MQEFLKFMAKQFIPNVQEDLRKFDEKLRLNPDILKRKKRTPLIRTLYPIKKTEEEAAKVTPETLAEEALMNENFKNEVERISKDR